MSTQAPKKGFTIVELMVVISIVALVAAVAYPVMTTTTRRNEVKNYVKHLRSALTFARGKAMEFTQPVQVTIDNDGGLLVLRDPTRDGNWNDAVLILGDGNPGNWILNESPYTHVEKFDGDTLPNDLPHWTLLPNQGNVSQFASNEIIILPDGMVYEGSPLANRGGTWYFQDDKTSLYGAVHITAMGEVRTAWVYPEELESGGVDSRKDTNGWNWE